jgi:hypothetical protein
MKFLSHIRKQAVVILTDVVQIMPSGEHRTIVPLYIAQFDPVAGGQGGDVNSAELAFAEQIYGTQANGRNLEMDQHTFVPLITRLSTYDTEADRNLAAYEEIDRAMRGEEHKSLPRGTTWKDGDMKLLVERTLLERAQVGNNDDFIVYEETVLLPPWPLYEEFQGEPEDLLGVLLVQGHDLHKVLAYERQQGTRPERIAIIEDELATRPEPAEGEFIPA